MILSLHVPKAAGNSFRELLQADFGQRFMKDYGDWAGFKVPEALERCRVRKRRPCGSAAMSSCKSTTSFTAISPPTNIWGLFPVEDFVAFFRDPYQQAVSHYWFLLRNPQREHLEEKMFHEAKMTLHDYLSWDAFYDHQSQYLGSMAIDDLAMVGLSEEFYRSVDLFNAKFGRNLRGGSFHNVNPDTEGGEYKIDEDIRRLVDKHRGADVELYRRAKEIFARQTAKAVV